MRLLVTRGDRRTIACGRTPREILIDAALEDRVTVYVQPTVTFVYPRQGRVCEDTPIADVSAILRSALTAESETERFAQSGRRGIALRLGLLDGPGTGHEALVRALGATLHVTDTARALLSANARATAWMLSRPRPTRTV